jgi:hypothetical protein
VYAGVLDAEAIVESSDEVISNTEATDGPDIFSLCNDIYMNVVNN